MLISSPAAWIWLVCVTVLTATDTADDDGLFATSSLRQLGEYIEILLFAH